MKTIYTSALEFIGNTPLLEPVHYNKKKRHRRKNIGKIGGLQSFGLRKRSYCQSHAGSSREIGPIAKKLRHY